MPTKKPKISSYVPQQIYDHFLEFQEERDLSMSQAVMVILAEYFGIEETIKEITEGTTVGGVTLAEFQQLKQKVVELENAFLSDKNKIVEQNKTTGEPPIENETEPKRSTSELPKNGLKKDSKSEFTLSPHPNLKKVSVSTKILALRLGVKVNSISSAKAKKDEQGFSEWSREKDPDNVTWIPQTKRTFVNKETLSDELLSKLQKWIIDNS